MGQQEQQSAQHTPGPWRVLPEECDKPYIRVRGSALGSRYKVANVLTPIYDGVHEREAAETRANARLIAAAPDLLAALQTAVHLYTQYGLVSGAAVDGISGGRWVNEARAAIAKATGSN